jgi:anti-sigma factor RsiW
MDCPQLEHISAWIDGELEAGEAARVEAHLASCGACRKARDQFLALGERVGAVDAPVDRVAQRRALRDVLASRTVRRRLIAVPVPVAASLVVALLAALVVVVALGIRERPAQRPAPATVGVPDLSRFDRGGRPAVVVRRVGEGR